MVRQWEAGPRALARAGAIVTVADLDQELAQRLAEEIGGRTADASNFLEMDVDIIAPCAAGGLIDENAASRLRAWAICGAANNQLASEKAGSILAERGILVVPDFLSSAGAVIAGVMTDMLAISDYHPHLEGLEATAREVLELALASGRPSGEIAEEMARARIAASSR